MRTLLAALLVATLALTSCTSDKESADDVASELAGALTKGELSAALFSGPEAQEAFDGIVEGLGEEATRKVEAGEVTEEDGSAEAALSWDWDVGGHTWEYETTAELTETESGWQVTWDPTIVEASLKDGETLDTTTLLPKRGDILGAGGVALVTDRPVVRLGIDKTKVRPAKAAQSARRVAALLDLEVAAYVKAVEAAGEKAFVEAVVLRPDDARQVDPAFDAVPGAVRIEDTMPLAPTREFAAPILGRVGPATAELIEESEGRLALGDVVGLSGLQQRYDEQLTGTKGLQVEAVAEDGAARVLFTADPVDGEPLRTTLDEPLQSKAERLLAVPDPAKPGPATALVAIRPSTGELLVAASGPGAGGLNAATFGQYAPGSTFKLVSSLALLRSGLTPQSPVTCPPSVLVDGKAFKNYGDYPSDRLGRITLRQAVANSCNTAFIGARDRIKGAALAEAAEALAFGVDFDLGFPAYFGQVPTPESETERAADLIGQGKILASPMVMAAVAASVEAGRTVVPYLLEEFHPEAEPATPLTAAEARALQELMRAVVLEGSGAFLAGLPGEVRAKTGTAEYGQPGAGGALPTHAWMVATQGDLAVAVFVETGESGSATAGPILERFLSPTG